MGWVFFRTDSLGDAMNYFSLLLGFGSESASTGLVAVSIEYDALLALVVAVCFSTKYPAIAWEALSRSKFGPVCRYVGVVTALALLAICMTAVASSTYSPFLYFRF